MPHTVRIDHGDHYEIIADYSLSPRHARLSAEQWRVEYDTDPSYAAMRKSHPGSIAGIVPKGVGRWKKDWSALYVAPIQVFKAMSFAKCDPDGIPSVHVNESHVVSIKKVNGEGKQIAGYEAIRVIPSWPVPITPAQVRLVDGAAVVTVGPATIPSDCLLKVIDPAGNIQKTQLVIRFF